MADGILVLFMSPANAALLRQIPPQPAHAAGSCQCSFADHVDDGAPLEVRLGFPEYFVSNRSDVPLS